jgi:hypothetical protein
VCGLFIAPVVQALHHQHVQDDFHRLGSAASGC